MNAQHFTWRCAVIGLACLPGFATGQAPSVCISVTDGCHVPNSVATARVVMSASEYEIYSGSLSLQYDPNVLRLVSLRPGVACDETSPFPLAVSQTQDDDAGVASLAFSVDFGAPPAQGGATLACARFVVLDNSTCDVCLFDGALNLTLVNEVGESVPIDNSADCPTSAPNGALACDVFTADATCDCPSGAPDCSLWDDDCNIGACNDSTARCEPVVTNQDGACDDGNACSTIDTCTDGRCLGTGCPSQSLCVAAEDTCRAIGETTVHVMLGQGEPVIVGGQFTLQYDPDELELLSVLPGNACDPTSPFELEIFESVDEAQGKIFYATSANPFAGLGVPTSVSGQIGTQGPTTLACVNFAVKGTGTCTACLLDETNRTLLIDESGSAVVPFAGTDCPPDPAVDAMSCGSITVTEDCMCTPGTDYCNVLNTECRSASCNEATGLCETTPIREGQVCDDGDQCTTGDTCAAGKCVGMGDGLPSLCVETNTLEFDPVIVVEMAVRIGESTTEIVGGQFSMSYDTDDFELLDIVPGQACDASSPFALVINESQNAATGEAFFATGVEFGGSGTFGPATLACARFRVKRPPRDGICLFEGLNPKHTVLVSASGQSVCIYNAEACPTNLPLPIITCADVPIRVPAISEWGLVVLTLSLLIGVKVLSLLRRRPTIASS